MPSPTDAVFHRIAQHANGVRIQRSPRTVTGHPSMRITGPRAADAAALLGGGPPLKAMIQNLTAAAHQAPAPTAESHGVIDMDIAQAILDGCALELSAAGLGRALSIPVRLDGTERFEPPDMSVTVEYGLGQPRSPIARITLVEDGALHG